MDYKTTSLPAAAYLICFGFKLVRPERQGSKVHFVFDDSDVLRSVVERYFADENVPAMSFFSALRSLKSVIYDS